MNDDVSARGTITALLKDDAEGVFDRLLPLVYRELRVMAHRHLRGERQAHTLDTTALVHEAYLKLVDQSWASAASRAYFFGAASRAMRQILVDHARLQMRKKRGGRERPVALVALDRVEDARGLLHRLDELSVTRYVSPFHRAMVYLSLGEVDRTLDFVEQSVAQRSWFVRLLGNWTVFDPLRSHPRFQKLLETVGLNRV